MKLDQLLSSSPTVDIYRSGDLAIKVFKKETPKTVVLYDALTHARVEEAGLVIPKISEVSVLEDGRWAISMDYIEGKTMAELMQEHPENLEQYVEQMVDIHIHIHSHTMPKLTKLKDKLAREINGLASLDDIKRYDLLTRLDSMPKHVKLCHNNFSPENILINDKGVFVLDWVKAKQGNASADVANTYLLFSLSNPELAEKYLNTFCEKTNTSKKYVQEWLPIVAAARLALGNPDEEKLLMKWIDVVAYE